MDIIKHISDISDEEIKVKEHHQDKILVIRKSKDKFTHDNVYCFDNIGQLVWQMEPINKIHEYDAILNLIILDNNDIEVFSGSGEYFILDHQYGSIIDSGRNKGKRPW